MFSNCTVSSSWGNRKEKEMEKENKSSQIIVRMTEREKEFLKKKAEEENRTISAIVNGALGEKYEEYREIRKRKKEKE